MSKIYCGINKTPKGHKLGSMKECAEKGQIRYYGLKKVDPKLLALSKETKKKKESREAVILKMVTLRGRIKGINKKLETEKNAKVIKKLKDDIEKAKEELSNLGAKLKKIESYKKQSRTSSRKSKRSKKNKSRKNSRK
jgi:hypothetical protein